jgi:hypothetical protein
VAGRALPWAEMGSSGNTSLSFSLFPPFEVDRWNGPAVQGGDLDPETSFSEGGSGLYPQQGAINAGMQHKK